MNDNARTLQAAITTAVTRAVQDPDVNAAPEAAGPIIAAVTQTVLPDVLHATNNEPWYRSRVVLGSLMTILAAILALFGVGFDLEMQSKLIDLILAAAPILGAGYALYGRLKARRPIGR
ncbi:hypothetical protein BJF92_12260 [Rhizobium rhizosphaerae]|uniref:Uncharacterized protein n=1 Tax=Xaviernesmea rhizosphaerae TaxID=1672749 RepID=A0A1Q9AN59_9HYPH|nr:hypothetical protein [Xaviernesmea rhizosphaerae]OLP56838.1 hypothetical protein BJF92_12260 [Xaviernesmea rhizosphaerae]